MKNEQKYINKYQFKNEILNKALIMEVTMNNLIN